MALFYYSLAHRKFKLLAEALRARKPQIAKRLRDSEYSETSINRTPIKWTHSIKRTLRRIPKLTSYISLYNELPGPIQRTPLLSGREQ